MKRSAYLDYAATTPVDPKVQAVMEPYFSKIFGNPSEIHEWGEKARSGVNQARTQISQILNCKDSEIIFTGCATESINLAHKGLIESIFSSNHPNHPNQPHIITSSIEHKAVLETCHHLEKLGWATITYLPVDKFGMVSVTDVEKALIPQTTLISLMYVNNEVGTIQPISEIGALVKKINVSRLTTRFARRADDSRLFFHTDATQAIPYLDCDVEKLGVDLLSFTGHKIYAPKGTGALFVKKGTPLVRQQDGGSQENNLRSGTENVPYIVGLGKAIELAAKNRVKESTRLRILQKSLISRISFTRRSLARPTKPWRSGGEGGLTPQISLTGHPTQRSPHIASFIIDGVEGEAMMLLLSDLGVAVSTGSACTSQSLSASHVLRACGIPPEKSHGSIRISLGKDTTKDDIDYAVNCIKKVVTKLRKMAPQF